MITLYGFIAATLVGLAHAQGFQIGRGIADMTGLLGDGALFGYARPDQEARGIHLRQFSRAFVIHDTASQRRVALVVGDVTLFSQAAGKGIIDRLGELGLGGFYSQQNVMFMPGHSHSLPGGYNTYWMYQAPSGGFINETYNILVEGVAESIRLAHNDLQAGNLLMSRGDLQDANINRSPTAYENNPAAERARYSSTVDKEMTLLKFVTGAGGDMGLVSFFPTHTTSLKNTNHIVSPDNKGRATFLMEQDLNGGAAPGSGSFVAGFAQASEGDASPNIDGARCTDTGLPCDRQTSTCPPDRDTSLCVGKGPTDDMFEDCRIIGDRQYNKAKELYNAASQQLSGFLDYRFQWVNMSDYTVLIDGQPTRLCRPAMGYSFAAGATDGPGAPPFFQGDTEGDPEIDAIRDLLLPPSDELMACHAPKPILLASGEADDEWPWQPEIVPTQIMRIGNLVIVGVPAEWTTMCGRRMADTVRNAMEAAGAPTGLHIVVTAMANSFTSYVTTFEEYQIQRYEGASTTYGPNTLAAYQDQYAKLATALTRGESVPLGQPPPDLMDRQEAALNPAPIDELSMGTNFGDVLEDVDASYNRGATAAVTFASANPRNNHRITNIYVEVQRSEGGSTWTSVFTDSDWSTKMRWFSDCHDSETDECDISQTSNTTVTWDIPANQATGTYRIRHQGYAKLSEGEFQFYTGTSSQFSVA